MLSLLFVIEINYNVSTVLEIPELLTNVTIAKNEPPYTLSGVIVEEEGTFITFVRHRNRWWKVNKGRAETHHSPTTFSLQEHVKMVVYVDQRILQ